MNPEASELQLLRLLRSLHDSEVEHVVFGAVALGFYGAVRATEDLDIIVRPTEANIGRVHDWLVSVNARLLLNPARSFGARERWAMLKGKNATVLTDLGRVDVVQDLPGLPEWDELLGRAEQHKLEGGLRVCVMDRSALVALKRRRASHLDLADIEAIEKLEQ